MARIKGEVNPDLGDHVTFRAHGIRLDLHMLNPLYNETAEKADEICLRVSALRNSIEAAGLAMNEFEQKWGLSTEQIIYLYDDLKQMRRLSRYKKKEGGFEKDWEKAHDLLSEYFIQVSFLSLRDEKDLPKGKVRSMIIWLYNSDESAAPLGQLAYLSKNFIF